MKQHTFTCWGSREVGGRRRQRHGIGAKFGGSQAKVVWYLRVGGGCIVRLGGIAVFASSETSVCGLGDDDDGYFWMFRRSRIVFWTVSLIDSSEMLVQFCGNTTWILPHFNFHKTFYSTIDSQTVQLFQDYILIVTILKQTLGMMVYLKRDPDVAKVLQNFTCWVPWNIVTHFRLFIWS